MFKMILAAAVAMGMGSVAFANDAKPAETTTTTTTETKKEETAPAAGHKMAKKKEKKEVKKEHAEGAAH